MNNRRTLWQRFLAGILAMVITVGILPLSAFPVKAETIELQLPEDGYKAFIDIAQSRATIKRSDTGEPYNDRSINGHALRKYKFKWKGATDYQKELNEIFNLDQVMYCIQYGVNLPSDGFYIAKDPTQFNAWTTWSQAVREGIMLSLGFGFPNTTLEQINAELARQGITAKVTEDDAVAATQVLVWECQQGLRNFQGKTPNLKMYRNYIEDTPAEPIYWYILELIQSYINNPKYDFEKNIAQNGRYRVWQHEDELAGQMMMGFHFTEDEEPPFYDTGKIEVYKKDPNGKPLAGAEFYIENNDDPTLAYTIIADKNGYACTDDRLPLGTYTVTETVFPEGYEPSEEEKKNYQWVVTVNGNQNNIITIDAINYQHGIITINKTVTGGTAADKAGWKFDIYDSNWKYVETVTTDQSGTAVTSRLLAGKYYVVEAGNTDPEKWNGKYWELDIGAKTGGSLNLLRNASLTSEALGYNYGWYGGDNTKLAYVTFDGMKCLYMADPTTTTSSQNIASFRQARIRLSAGTYTFSGKVYVEEERPVRISIYLAPVVIRCALPGDCHVVTPPFRG